MKNKYLYLLYVVWCGDIHAKPLTAEEATLTPSEFAAQELKNKYDVIYFLPDNAAQAKKTIIGLIDQEKKTIRAALFRLTEPTITKALIDAHKRGVDVEVIIDPGALGSNYYSKVGQLLKEGIKVYVYQTTGLISALAKDGISKNDLNDTKYQTIMHHKTLILNCTIGGKPIVTYGSLNLTHAGFSGNEELVAIRNDRYIVAQFQDQFEHLKKRSYRLEYTAPAGRCEHGGYRKHSKQTHVFMRGMHIMAQIAQRIVH